MRSHVLRRRAATAAGIYGAAVLGILGTIVAQRQMSIPDFGVLTIVLMATGFVQSLLDLTVEEAAVKFGFRYTTAKDWARFRRLIERVLAFKLFGGLAAGLVVVALTSIASSIWNVHNLTTPLLIAALIPLVQAPEGLAGVMLILRGRYDVRGAFLAFSTAMRLIALAVGSRYGVVPTVIGLVAAQVVSTMAISVVAVIAFRRFPSAPAGSLARDRSEIRRFVLQSSLATTVISLRGMFGPLALGSVSSASQVAYLRTAQAPQSAMAILSAPARTILLAEQTRDWEEGKIGVVFAGVRRYTVAAAMLALVLVPPLFWLMPDLIRLVYKAKYLPATDSARLILLAAAIQAVVGWSKSFPVSIGRPGLRILAHGVEVAVFVPLVFVLGALYGATGAAGAVLASSIVFVVVWAVLIVRLKREHMSGRVGETTTESASTS
jgi:O-antigen/teichoic acid export membrane protein